MKNYFLILIIIVFNLSCSNQQPLKDVEYIKVLSWGDADSITLYNKGLGLTHYAYYNPKSDSFIYSDYTYPVRNDFATYLGHLTNAKYVDTFAMLLNSLRQYDVGVIQEGLPKGAGWDGSELYVEFKDRTGIYYYDFSGYNNDTLHKFIDFFFRLPDLQWQKKTVSNKMVNKEEEAVAAFKRAGLYDKREIYIPQSCAQEINIDKLPGVWRSIRKNEVNTQTSFYKLTVTKNGDWLKERYIKGKLARTWGGQRVRVNPKNKTFTFLENPYHLKYTILMLSDNCFEYRIGDSEAIECYNRILRDSTERFTRTN